MWHGGTRHRTWHGPCAMAALPLGHRHVRCPPRSPRTYIGLSPRKSQRHGRAVPRTVKFLALPAARPARWIELLLEDAPRRAAYSGDAATCGIHGARARARRAPPRRPATARARGARSLERVGSIGPYTSTSGPKRRHDVWRHNGDTPITVTVAPTAHDAKAQRAKTDRPRTESRGVPFHMRRTRHSRG